MTGSAPPEWLHGSPLLVDAYLMADEAHSARSDEGTRIEHPATVARLLEEAGFEEDVVAAALLHDVIEDTTVSIDEVEGRFGPEIARLVDQMTEDPGIEGYEERKAEHRSRISRDHRVAAIYAADKVASTRSLDSAGDAPAEKLAHYRRTLRVLCETHPELPFLGQIEEELDRLRA